MNILVVMNFLCQFGIFPPNKENFLSNIFFHDDTCCPNEIVDYTFVLPSLHHIWGHG